MLSARGVGLLVWGVVLAACGVSCRAAPSHAAVPVVVSTGALSSGGLEQTSEGLSGGAATAQNIGGMSMQMTFFGGNTFHLWFDAFQVHDAGTLAAACIGLAIMAALYEGLKVLRIILVDKIDCSKISSLGHGFQVCLHIVQVACSYLLMLATMTYSSWVLLSVCAGAGLGYAIFAPLVSKRALLGGTSDHCH